MRKTLLSAIAFLASFFVHSQQLPASLYDPHDFFTEGFNPPRGNVYRSASGIPGPMYWQNRADYQLHATLNEKDSSIDGEVRITYTNNSPDKLDYLWLQLDQNLFKKDSRGALAVPASGDQIGILDDRGDGLVLGTVSVTYHGSTYTAKQVISDTRMQVRLNNPLLPKGDQIVLTLHFHFKIPVYGADRMGRLNTKNGMVYTIGQWYPRLCVYDDIEGWNTLPYMGLGEFYCDYGDYDYTIIAPANLIIHGSGDLQNPAEVLTPEQVKRLSLARNSDKTLWIISPEEAGKAGTRPKSSGMLTWHFTMKNTRDVAWAASRSFVWDAARVNLPSGRKALAQSVYPLESVGDSSWSRATEYLKESMENYSKYFYEYPWNNAIDMACNITGMEYPGIIFNDYQLKKARMWFLAAHEIGHNWYPMIVGSNERKYMWQDEGFNSYINFFALDSFNRGEYAADTAIFNKNFFAYLDQQSLPTLKDPLMTVSEGMDLDQHYQYYSKTAFGLRLLRNTILGRERFDYAFKKYTETWAFKHPTPYDFFHFMNNASGEDLNWFWKEWFFTVWTLDQGIAGVASGPSGGSVITIENKGKLIMPVVLKIYQKNGTTEILHLPVEIWQRNKIFSFNYSSASPVEKIILDPDNVFPDVNRNNNVWMK